jgi:hypothetical protein
VKRILISASAAAAVVTFGLMAGDSVQGVIVKKPFDHSSRGKTGSTQILYHGGPVLTGTVPVYVIYYGNQFATTTQPILNDFFANLAPSGQYNVNTTYYQTIHSTTTYVSNALAFTPPSAGVPSGLSGSVYFDSAYSIGKSVSNSGPEHIIKNAFANGLPVVDGAVYFVVTSPDVSVSGFCHSFCAYHSKSTSIAAGHTIHYALIPDPTQRCAGCDGNAAIYGESATPNGDMGADEMTDSIMHELSETVTDPDLNAWYTSSGAENGDLCNFNYGTTYTVTNPDGQTTTANAHLGKRDYLIQTIWQNSGPGFCANTLSQK